MNYELMKHLKDVNEENIPRIYTVPTPGERWKVSQIEGMTLFSLALTETYDWYRANHLQQRH